MKRYYPQISLLVVSILAYGLLLPQLGFYWDDLPISWIRYQLGPAALTQYFSTNRPVWGLLYQLTTSFIPYNPVYWQAFALFWRWLGAVVVFAIVEKLWRDRPRFAYCVALLFLIYPGFNQQWSAFLYGHFFVVMFFFLVSHLYMLRALDAPARYGRLTLLGMFFSALNLWMMEYFYVLELMRVGVILTALRNDPMSLRDRVGKTIRLWLPYLFVFIAAVLSRLLIFNNQIYGIGLGDRLKSAPVETLVALLQDIRLTLILVLRDAWLSAVRIPEPASIGNSFTPYIIAFGGVILVAIIGFLLLPRDTSQVAVSRLEDVLSSLPAEQNLRDSMNETPQKRRTLFSRGSESVSVFLLNFRKNLLDGAWVLSLGLINVLLAGWPFWLIGFTPSLAWPASRFTLPFMFGVALILAGIALLIPWQNLGYLVLVILVGFGAGRQFLRSSEYKQDWEAQKSLFWQMIWRAPGIQPDTAVLMNEGGLKFYADNSLSPVLNWVYGPDEHDDHIEYVLLYPTTRLKSDALPKLEPDLPIFTDYLAGTFNGNTSQVLAVYFAPPGCMRVLDPGIDRLNRMIPEGSLMRFAARLSNPGLILPDERSRMPGIYNPEPEHGWCYFYEKAELARQFGDWKQVVSLGEDAFQLDRPSNDPAELFVFIEGYAHAGEWTRAIDLSHQSFQVSEELVGPMLCRLWERIEAETAPGEGRDAAFVQARTLFSCNP